MREMLNKYIFLISCLLAGFEVVSQGGPVPPPPVPPPPGLSVDGSIVILFGVSLLFGFYKIYISVVKKKRSV